MEQDETQITLFSARNITLAFIMLIGFIRIKDIEKYAAILLCFSWWIRILVWFYMVSPYKLQVLELTVLSTIVWLPDIKKDFRVVAYTVLAIFGLYYSYNLLELFE